MPEQALVRALAPETSSPATLNSAMLGTATPGSGPAWQAVLLDRDGTVNRERADYVKSWAEFEWLPGALDALASLATLHIPIIIVSNQSPIGRGILEADTVAAIHERMCSTVAAAGGRIDAFFVCPHRPDEHCACRKPKPGLLLQAAQRFHLDLGRCIFVGDAVTDWQAAQAAGCACVLVRTGRQGNQLAELLAALPATHGNPAHVPIVADLAAAVACITAAPGSLVNQFETAQ